MGYYIGFQTPNGEVYVESKTVYQSYQDAQKVMQLVDRDYPDSKFFVLDEYEYQKLKNQTSKPQQNQAVTQREKKRGSKWGYRPHFVSPPKVRF